MYRPTEQGTFLTENFCQILRLLAFLVVRLVAKYGRLTIDFFTRSHDISERTMLLGDAPGGHRSFVHSLEIIFPADVLQGNPKLRDCHKRRQTLGPDNRSFLDRHPFQVSTELDLNVELIWTIV